MQYIKSVLWQFGDGRTSTEYNPNHTYAMAGIYEWHLTVTDLFGRTVKTSGFIRVYDWDYLTDLLHVAYTDKCFRFALKPQQGVGAVEWKGDHWLWPPAYTGTCKGITDAGDTVSLVLNNANGRFYRIGIRDIWQDRIGNYGGYNIECAFRLKEHTAVAGEYQEIEHIESHVHMRPFWETNKNLTGFTSEGFLTDYALGLNIFENGEQTSSSAQLENVPRYGDYVYRKRIEARRLQLEVEVETSAWRCIKVQQMMMPIDKASGPDFDYPSENQWQAEFSTPDLWMSRDSVRPILNRATGINFGGTRDTLATGPDTLANSAVNFAAINGLNYGGLAFITGDMTLSLWLSGIVATPITLWQMNVNNGNTLNIRLVTVGTSYAVEFTDGTNSDTRTLSWNSTGWVLITVEKNGTTLRVFENGVQLSATPMTNATLGYGSTINFPVASICTLFDVRRNNRAISSSALVYYYQDIINNNGNGGLLPIMR